MVQVTVRVRPKNGYTYPNKIKTVTLDSADRLEDLLQKHASATSATSATSSHAALYLNGRELPLNSSVASHNLDDGVILEACKSPLLSATISAVLRDLEYVQKKTKEEKRTKNLLKDVLQVPVYLVNENDDNSDNSSKNGDFWNLSSWTNEKLKQRIICLATIKKILQRDDRYAVHDIPLCTDCKSLYENLQPVWERHKNHNRHLFKPSTKKNGNPSTIWILLEQKLNIQMQIVAEHTPPRDNVNGDNHGSLDALEEFIRLDTLRHQSDDDKNTSNTGKRRKTAASTPNRKRRRTQSDNIDHNHDAILASTPNHNNQHPSRRDITSTPRGEQNRRPRQYCPEYASGPFAILCSLIEAMEGKHKNSNGRRQLSLKESELKCLAQPRCRSNLYDRQVIRGRNAFACMEGLAEKQLVRKEIIMDTVEKWALLPAGEIMAKKCLNFENAVDAVIPNDSAGIINIGQSQTLENDEMVLVVDTREDAHFRSRLKTLSQDESIPTVERELPAGDYVFLQKNNILPIVIERKSWSDLADSVLVKGKAHQRLDCVKLGTNYECCESQNCQLCKMKRSGCSQIMFIIEGSRCRGRDGYRDNKCSDQKPCQACKSLIERHGPTVTQKVLEKVLHRLIVQHGCYVHFTRSYNETVSSLFLIRNLLLEGKSFAASMMSEKQITYEQFCSNACLRTRRRKLHHRKKESVVEWQCDGLVSMMVNKELPWKQVLRNDLLGLTYESSNKISNEHTRTVIDIATSNRTGKLSRKTQRLNRQKEKDTICIDLDSDNSGQEDTSIELIEVVDSRESSDDDDVVCLNDNSQHSIEIIERSSSKSKGSSQLNQISSKENRLNAESCNLLILHGSDDYDEKFLKTFNKCWQQCYSNNANNLESDLSYDIALQSINGMINHTQFVRRNELINAVLWIQIKLGVFVCPVERNLSADSLKQLLTQPTVTTEQSSSRKVVTATTPTSNAHNRSSSHRTTITKSATPNSTHQSSRRTKPFTPVQICHASLEQHHQLSNISPITKSIITNLNHQQSTERTKLSSPETMCRPTARRFLNKQYHESTSLAAMRKKSAATAFNNEKSTVMTTKPPHVVRKIQPSARRTIAIDARLRRFENKNDTEKKTIASSTKKTWTCSCTLVNNYQSITCDACGCFDPNRTSSSTSSFHSSFTRISEDRKRSKIWTCKCTLDNDFLNAECDACGQPNPTRRIVKESLVPQTDIISSYHLGGSFLPDDKASTSKKKHIRCGACGVIGHNRGNATKETCSAYDDEKEVFRREEKLRKTQEKVIATQRDYEIFQQEEESRKARQVELMMQMEEMKKDMEKTATYSKAEMDRRRKKAESAKKRADRQHHR